MKQKNDKDPKEQTTVLIGFFILMAWIYIPLYLLSKELYLLSFLLILGGSCLLVFFSKKVLIENINHFFKERKKLKRLDYYYILDNDKLIDIEQRRRVFSLFNNLTSGTVFVFLFNFLLLYLPLTHWFGNSTILNIVTGVLLFFITVFGFGGFLSEFVYKHTTIFYISIPFVSSIIFFSTLATKLGDLPDVAGLGCYLLITALIYLSVSKILPVHVLRNLNNQTVLISAVLTISAAFANQVFSIFFWRNVNSTDYHISIEKIIESKETSTSLKKLLIDNPKLIDLVNNFLDKEITAQLSSVISLSVTGITLSFLIGGYLINRKIRKNKSLAKKEFRNMLKNPDSIDYPSLVKCAFYGGEAYENLILSESSMRDIVFMNEKDLKIPDTSIRKRFLEWFKKNSVIYSFFITWRNREN